MPPSALAREAENDDDDIARLFVVAVPAQASSAPRAKSDAGPLSWEDPDWVADLPPPTAATTTATTGSGPLVGPVSAAPAAGLLVASAGATFAAVTAAAPAAAEFDKRERGKYGYLAHSGWLDKGEELVDMDTRFPSNRGAYYVCSSVAWLRAVMERHGASVPRPRQRTLVI